MQKAVIRLASEFARLLRDQTGQVMIYFVILLPVMLGLIGLSLEGGRLLMLNSQLQDLADAAALAGAKELDGTDDAIDRATNAAENILSNDTWWSNVILAGVQIVDPPVFYSALKGAPSDNPAAADVVTTVAKEAAYIKVTTVTRQVLPAFLIAVGAASAAQTSATATAGTTYIACNVQPLMLCNPFEQTGGGGKEFEAAVKDGTVRPGMLFHMKVLNDPGSNGSNQSFAPGDFGLLDPPGENSSGANTTRNLLSSQSPNFCYVDSVSPRTGQAVSKTSDGINVRFDIPVNGSTTGLDQSPAPDVVKGMIPKNASCNGQYNDLGASARYPLDSSWTNYGNMQLGNGTMVFPDSYWQYHHGANWPSDLLAAGQPNRYLAYQRELGMTPMSVPGTENPVPVCNATTSESTAQRRTISVAVIDCLANNVKGNSTTNVRSNAYVDFFITQPSLNYSNMQGNGEVWGEFVQLITPQSAGGKLHQIVQLYRDCDPAVTAGCH
jgi:Flp pilus assembly protein TadG